MNETSVNILHKLTRYFFNGSLDFSLEPEHIQKLTWEIQEEFINSTIKHEIVKKYPMSIEFCRLFFKKLIGYLEPTQEVHDEFYTALCSILRNGTQGDFYYRHYIIGNYIDIVTIKETKNMVVNGTTGMRTWQAALMLADWAISNRNIFYGKRVLELGSGVGFTGIAIAKNCSVHSITLTDCHDDVLRAICDNIQINFPNLHEENIEERIIFNDGCKNLGVMMLDWNSSIDKLPDDLLPDLIIGADIIYDPTIFDPLCNVLKIYFEKNKQLEVYIANIIRNEDTYRKFIETLDSLDINHEEIQYPKCIHIEWDDSIHRCLLKIKLHNKIKT